MKVSTAFRILLDGHVRVGARQAYWSARRFGVRAGGLLRPEGRPVRGLVARDALGLLPGSVRPVAGETDARIKAAVGWILQAQAATADGGVSLGYFPCEPDTAGWMASYPETTGYIITSLLRYADQFHDARARDAALAMARWEVAVQMPSGAVQGGPVCPPEKQTAAAFNTGMVLDGWCSVQAAAPDPAILAAARRAADFLAGDIGGDGYFRTNGAFVSGDRIKTYTCLCAWALDRFGRLAGEDRYRQAALRAVEAALRQQGANGWFANNCLTRAEAPLTHTIGYTLQGVLEVGLAAGRDDFVAAVRRGVDPLLMRIGRDGFLHGRFYGDWEPAAFSSCLTGSAQIAIVCYRLFETGAGERYRLAADRLVDFLKALQRCDHPDARVRGALPGSFPFWGQYMSAGFPNWATKYLLDALMLQKQYTPAGAR